MRNLNHQMAMALYFSAAGAAVLVLAMVAHIIETLMERKRNRT